MTTCIVGTGRDGKARPSAVHIRRVKGPACEFYTGTGPAA